MFQCENVLKFIEKLLEQQVSRLNSKKSLFYTEYVSDMVKGHVSEIKTDITPKLSS